MMKGKIIKQYVLYKEQKHVTSKNISESEGYEILSYFIYYLTIQKKKKSKSKTTLLKIKAICFSKQKNYKST